ncbi:MAG: DUF6452 family protein [Bacteroidota bacterium]
MKKKFFSPSLYLWVFLFLGWLLSSCDNTSDCSTEVAVTQLNVRFLKHNLKTLQNDTARVYIKKITVAPVDSFPNAIFYLNQYATAVTLNLNPNADVTHFIFEYAYKTNLIGGKDTISVSYRRNYELTSINCNARINFSKIDTIGIPEKLAPPFVFGNFTDNTIDLYVPY